MAVRDTVDDGHCDCSEKDDVRSEHRDEAKFSKVIKNIETDQNSRKVITNIETGKKKSRKVITSIETGQSSRKVITRRVKIRKSGHEDRDARPGQKRKTEIKTWVNSCRTSEILKKIEMNLLVGQKIRARKTERNRDERAGG